jgi:hypothetical protein
MRPRHLIAPVVVVAFEVWLYLEYAQLDALLHYWLHALLGAVFAVGAVTAVALVRRRAPRGVWSAGALGHLYSAVPDVLFLAAGILHVAWMDVFALHVTVHFIPVPLATLFALFVLTLGAWAACALGRRRLCAVTLVAALLLTFVAFAVADAPPSTLEELRAEPRIALFCPLTPAAGTSLASHAEAPLV